MTLNEYQEAAERTAIYPKEAKLLYPVLGLAGEAGEVAGKVAKIYRDDKGELTKEKREAIIAELGDCLWMISAAATDLNVNLESIAKQNLEKLASRAERGVIHGDGDKR